MASHKQMPSIGFGTRLTSFGKKLLTFYAAIYGIELICQHWLGIPLASVLLIYPFSSQGFHFWQILTHPFVHNPYSPFVFAIGCVVFYFFAGPVETALGLRSFLVAFFGSALGGAMVGLSFGGLSPFDAPFGGMMPSLLSLVVVFGLLNPEATILLMFILPIKAKYLSYGTILVSVLMLLAKANPHGAYHLGGILVGYLYLRGPRWLLNPSLIRLRYLQWQLDRKKARLRVINGEKDKSDGPPTIH